MVLPAPGREIILNEAKYITHITAQEAAISLLKAESKRPSVNMSAKVNNLPLPDKTSAEIDAMAAYINSYRR